MVILCTLDLRVPILGPLLIRFWTTSDELALCVIGLVQTDQTVLNHQESSIKRSKQHIWVILDKEYAQTYTHFLILDPILDPLWLHF